MSEQQGPFYIEANGNCYAVRSNIKFTTELVIPLKATKQGKVFALSPMALDKGMKLVLHAEGFDDVIVPNEE